MFAPAIPTGCSMTSFLPNRLPLALAVLMLGAASCATPAIQVPAPPAVSDVSSVPAVAVAQPASFADLPDWSDADPRPAREAFLRTCRRLERRQADAPFSDRFAWTGSVADWAGPCEALKQATDTTSARLVIEALFVPMEIRPEDGASRFTGYFEPEIQARRRPDYPFTQPVPGLPDDLVQVDGSVIGEASGTRVPAQRLPDGRLRPYPPRSEIALRSDKALGFAHPADVFFLQIQGSGRLVFPDGEVVRAAYAAHNGQPFRSTANHLIEQGKITRGEASMQGIRAWMDRVSREEAQAAMNANPRFVFFRPLAIDDPAVGPVGAEGVPLTPLGSMAIDTSLHPLGMPFYVTTNSPGLGGNWSAVLVGQDTGGAIKGRVRGDIYFGTGAEAGDRAGTQNAPGRMWALVPRAVASSVMRSSGLPES